MKCRLIVATFVMNPLWSEAARNAAKDRGVPYKVAMQVEVGPGYVIEDPQAWIQCCPGDLNSPAIAEPADDECREAVREFMEVKRPAGIAAIRAQYEQIDTLTNEQDKQRLKEMARAYGLISDAGSKKSAKTPAV